MPWLRNVQNDSPEGAGWMSRLAKAIRGLRDFRASLTQPGERALFGIIDFSYQHYALGDALTSLVDMSTVALDSGVKAIDLVLVLDPDRPSAGPQGFITPHNYTTYLDNLFPAYLCSPMVRSIRVLRERPTFNHLLLSAKQSGMPIWPGMLEHLHARFTFPFGHQRLNRFFQAHGYLPMLAAPRGYERWADQFLAKYLSGRFVVCTNLRNSALTPSPAVTYRDAPLEEWYAFFREIERKYPEVVFFMLGSFAEQEHRLSEHPNVISLRALGFGLAHELALLYRSDLFIGSSSGFASAAMFSALPYVILNTEHFFAEFAEVPVHSPHYPFAADNQILVWRREDADLLLGLFEQLYRQSRAAQSSMREAFGRVRQGETVTMFP